MRVLHVDTGAAMRGGQWQALRLVEGLAAAGVDGTLLARRDGPLLEAARLRGLPAAPLGWARLAVLARRHDVVHAHDARAHTMAAVAGGAPLVVARRVAFGVRPGLGSRWKYGRAARYIAVSEYVKGILAEGGVAAARVAVVYDGVPLLPPSRGTRIVAPADNGDPLKGTPMASWAADVSEFPLYLSDDLEEDLRTAGVFVYITYSEGLGSGVLLAMSAGVAVVASSQGGLKEVIEHGVDGMLVENTPMAIGQAVRELIDHPEFARGLGQAARRKVNERFTVDRMVRETMEVYRQVLS
jgi:Glycosyl transferases group 1/Glycosyltransferase Family 4